MPISRNVLRRSCLLTVLLFAGGCSKLEKAFGDPPGARLPDAPFSLDCHLKSLSVGHASIDPPSNPAWMRIQLNPKGGFFRIVDYGGSLSDFRSVYKTTDYFKNDKRDKNVETFEEWGGIPFISSIPDQTYTFRISIDPAIVILAEHNEVRFTGPIGPIGKAVPYMSLNIKERALDIRYEWRDSFKTYADYQRHGGDGPASFRFSCARSPKDTVTEVDGFNQ